MRIEHVAFTVPDPAATARWYVQHLGLRIVRSMTETPYMHFLGDAEGHVLVEIYNNPKVAVPDYRRMDPLLLHLAFVSADVKADRARLLAAGAAAEGEITLTPAGDELAMIRDPWGFCIQLCKRRQSML